MKKYFLLALWALTSAFQAYGAVILADVDHPDTPSSLLRLHEGGAARIGSIPLGLATNVTANLEKFSVFAPNATVTVYGPRGVQRQAPPAIAHFRGEVEGHPGSRVFWSVAENGDMRGITHIDGEVFVSETLHPQTGRSGQTHSRRVEKHRDFQDRKFECGAEALPGPASATGTGGISPQTIQMLDAPVTAALNTTPYNAYVAVDTDYEFLQLFSNTNAATQYVADLFAYISTIYSGELQATLQVSDLFFYSSAGSDPWTVTSDTNSALTQLRNYWKANRNGISRTIVHQLSGKNLGGGVAYLSALCDSNFGYGLSASLGGNFNPANPQVIWDSFVVAHEIGHNFGSPHTHYYGSNGSDPVDCCSDSDGGLCANKTKTLPGIGSLAGGTSGAGDGTIMSYCHQQTGGISNITMTFGKTHVYGVAANRVPTLMRQTLENAAASSPACFVSANNNFSLSVVKSGGGMSTVSSSPAGIDCGATCISRFPNGTSVTLSATPASGYIFDGWSGDCSGAGACMVMMNATKVVSANFSIPDDNFPLGGSLPAGWIQPAGSSLAWTVASDSANGGLHSLKSGAVGNTQTSGIAYTAQFSAGMLSFAHRVSSEQDYDYLRFYIDGIQQGQWSGENPWHADSYPISAGVHQLKWQYEKDLLVSAGSDAAWIDTVILPPNTAMSNGLVVLRAGLGSGTVNSSPAGIACGSTCAAAYAAGTVVTLSASPDPGFVFAGWSGACSGSGPCVLNINSILNVSATFALADDNFPPGGSLPVGWTQPAGSTLPWAVANDATYAGSYSLKSAQIGNLKISGIGYTGQFAAGNIKFALRVSSEATFDFLRFYIDGVKQNEWSGELPWQLVSFPISAGSHTLKWQYEKDATSLYGFDAAWIDSVSLPLPTTVLTGIGLNPASIAEGGTATILPIPSDSALGVCSSADPNVATVAGFTVTGVTAGSTSISCSGKSATITVIRVATLSAASLTFQSQAKGTSSAARTVSLGNASRSTLHIGVISSSVDFPMTTDCGSTLSAGASCNINISFAPLLIGAHTGSLSIATDAAGSPHTVTLGGIGAIPGAAITAGGAHNAVLKSDGTVWAWGLNGHGQVGIGSFETPQLSPIKVPGQSGIAAIAAGQFHVITLKSDGTVWTWGNNQYGQLGDGTTNNGATPMLVLGGDGVKAISAGYDQTFALKADGTVQAWGYNGYGQLGDGTTTDRWAPVPVPNLSGVTAITVNVYHGIALNPDHTARAWGYNGTGALGDGTTSNRSVPVQVQGLANIASVMAGLYHSVALKTDGTVWTWGYNNDGELGDGTSTWRSSPGQIASLSNIAAISVGTSGQHSIALKADGTVWAWGQNSNGQLGDGTLINRVLPVRVTGLSGVTAIAAGNSYSLALKSDGTIWAWGSNSSGQLGDGTTTQQTSPVQVAGFNVFDTVPDAFAFTARIGIAPGTLVQSNAIVISGINGPAAISISGGLYSIDGGSFTSTPGTVNNGQSIAVQLTSSAFYSTLSSATLTIGGISGMFNVTTLNQSYAVIYNGNTSTGGAVPVDAATYTQGATITVPGNTGSLAKTGYTFAGWNTAANGTGSSYAAAATFAMGAANVTLYAQWAINSYTVSATAGFGGIISPANRTVNYGSSTTFTVAPDSGYTAVVSGCGGSLNGSIYTTAAITSNCTVSAIFTPNAVQASLMTGWNLIGNSVDATLDVAAAFGDAARVNTVWKWLPVARIWAFYTPSLNSADLNNYAASKGYEVLVAVNGGEGFWVNARSPFTATLPAGAPLQSASFIPALGAAPGGAHALPHGWSLIATGDNPTPLQFDAAIATLLSTPPAAGSVYANFTTLWAWDATNANWYFWAPALVNNGSLTSYIANKNYLDFTTLPTTPPGTLSPAMGFWINMP